VENSSVVDVINDKRAGRLDSQTAEHHQQALLAVLDKNIAAVMLDFSAVTHLSTKGIRVLLWTSRAYQAKGMPFVLHSLFPAPGLGNDVYFYKRFLTCQRRQTAINRAPTIPGHGFMEKVSCDMKTDPPG
jgi:hypothetical protein